MDKISLKGSFFALLLTLFATAVPRAAFAYPGWHGNNIHDFHRYDYGRWRGGYWNHGFHGGRDGWFWVVGGSYYWYPRAVYPFPDPYIPPVVMQAPVVVQPPVVQAPPAQPPPSVVQAQPPASMWYHCARPDGYYPYVAECPSGWSAVPAAPANDVASAPQRAPGSY